ncbi:hypothetical protein QYE76_013745 [Lolium multiflorum]|uniref:MATH domain-containing protein n=1 Tax=Lolium multiflorum TaxID=4521 RepID=A0AAD8U3K9_LOLMU|nr:hypothetical protein QYE76_013745 [Lolium multiflorum]
MGNINSCWAEPPAAETSSSCITKTATAAHNFTVTNYSLLKGMGMGKFVSSRPFSVGGYSWQIRFCPDGADQEHAGYAAAFLCRCDGAAATTGVQTKYTLSLRHTDGKVHGCSGRLAHVVSTSAGPPPSTVGHGCTRCTWDAVCVAADRLRLHGLHRRFFFAVIARDITDNVANDSDLRHVVHAMARVALPSVAAPPHWSTLLANDAPSEARTSLVVSRRCTDSRPAATLVPRAVVSPHAVTFAVPRASTSEATSASPLLRGLPPSAHGLRHAAGSSSPTSSTAFVLPPQVAAGLANHSRSR